MVRKNNFCLTARKPVKSRQLSQASLQMTFSVGFGCIMDKAWVKFPASKTNLSSVWSYLTPCFFWPSLPPHGWRLQSFPKWSSFLLTFRELWQETDEGWKQALAFPFLSSRLCRCPASRLLHCFVSSCSKIQLISGLSYCLQIPAFLLV